MSDPLFAHKIYVESCREDCPCQSVHISLDDPDGECFAAASMQPQVARVIAAELLAAADTAEARKLRQGGAVVMILLYILCLGVDPGQTTCSVQATWRIRYQAWQDTPCDELVHPKLRPFLPFCEKQREVAL